MCLHVLGGPLVHWGHGTVRLRAAAEVLKEQVLRHGGLLVLWWVALAAAPHFVSGAGRDFSTWNHLSSSETVRIVGTPAGTALVILGSPRGRAEIPVR